MDLTANASGGMGVDVHAHYFGTDLEDLVSTSRDDRWPRLVRNADGDGTLMLGDAPFRAVRSVLWDIDRRIADLDSAGIGLQVISPVPVTLAYWADRSAAVDYARASNDSIADAVRRSRGRLAGLGTLPLPHIDEAVAELHRVVGPLGLYGVEIGTQIAGQDLDSPMLELFFAAAEELGAVLFIHPMDGGGGVLRRTGQPYDFGLGMISDTAIAATSLIFGGVLERHPGLRVAYAHGCGTFPWAYPRIRLGGSIFNKVDADLVERLVSSLWVDSLVFDPRHLQLLAERFGADHLMLGTDYPFIPGQLEGGRAFLDTAADIGALTTQQAQHAHRDNALAFLGLFEHADSAPVDQPAEIGRP